MQESEQTRTAQEMGEVHMRLPKFKTNTPRQMTGRTRMLHRKATRNPCQEVSPDNKDSVSSLEPVAQLPPLSATQTAHKYTKRLGENRKYLDHLSESLTHIEVSTVKLSEDKGVGRLLYRQKRLKMCIEKLKDGIAGAEACLASMEDGKDVGKLDFSKLCVCQIEESPEPPPRLTALRKQRLVTKWVHGPADNGLCVGESELREVWDD